MNRLYSFLAILIGIIFYYISRLNYPLFHIGIEYITVLIGILIFTITVLSEDFNQSSLLTNLGPGIFVVSIITFLHSITYKGMNLIQGYDTNLPTQLWIVLNYILAISVLITVVWVNKRLNFKLEIMCYSALGFLGVALCFMRIFPECFVEGTGLTAFKIASEYIIILLYGAGAVIFYRRRKKFHREIYKPMLLFIALLMTGEFMFTLYSNVYGISNFLGHYIRLIAFSVLYVSIVTEGIKKPYTNIFRELSDLSVTDSLTGLKNRRFFNEAFEKYKRRSINEGKSMYLMIVDVDFFKEINDKYGHQVGDEVLVETARMLKEHTRDTDIATRQGGDEFAIIFWDVNREAVSLIVNRIKEAFESTEMTDMRIKVSLSGGVSKYSGGGINEFIKSTDQMMYHAKEEGRNRILFNMDSN